MKKHIFTLSLFCSLFDLQAKDSTTFTVGASLNFYRKDIEYRSFNISLGLQNGRNRLELGPAIINYPRYTPEIEIGAFVNYSRRLNKRSSIFDPYIILNFLWRPEMSFGVIIYGQSFQSFVGYGVRLNITKVHSISSDFNIGRGWLSADGHSFPSILMYNLKYNFCF